MERLPIFPTPYPEETFYSILSRAFLRNGYYSEQMFIKRLFGKKFNIRHTLLVPYGVHYCSQWVDPQSGITAQKLLLDHTCVQYGVLPSHPSETDLIRQETDEGIHNTFRVQSRMFRFRKYSLPDYIRYCPLCAIEDAEDYGEPYWHRIHQIREVLYCPKHKVRILDSSISLISYTLTGEHFFPASYVLDELANGGIEKAGQLLDEKRTEPAYRDLHLLIDTDIQWLLSNGFKLAESPSLFEHFKEKLNEMGIDYNNKLRNQFIAERIKKCLSNDFLNSIQLSQFCVDHFYDFINREDNRYAYYLPTILCVFGMKSLSGSAEKFYNESQKR